MRLFAPLSFLAVLLFNTSGLLAADAVDDGWSPYNNGIQARLVLEQRPRFNGTRKLVPYLELRNKSQQALPIHIRCDEQHLYFEHTDAKGKVLTERQGGPVDGISLQVGTVVLPFDSSIRIFLGSTIYGVPQNAAAMISTDSGAWTLIPEEKGKTFLRVTVHGDAVSERGKTVWHGKVQASVKIDWKEDQ